jgi:5-methylcytosine-specific restriction endonuclease McrA
MKRWRESNPDKVKELRRVYKEENQEAILARVRTQKARRRAAAGIHTGADIATQYRRQKGRCYWGRVLNPTCAVTLSSGYHVDHVIPIAAGGSNGPENLVLACPDCNLRKGAKHPMDFAGVMF